MKENQMLMNTRPSLWNETKAEGSLYFILTNKNKIIQALPLSGFIMTMLLLCLNRLKSQCRLGC